MSCHWGCSQRCQQCLHRLHSPAGAQSIPPLLSPSPVCVCTPVWAARLAPPLPSPLRPQPQRHRRPRRRNDENFSPSQDARYPCGISLCTLRPSPGAHPPQSPPHSARKRGQPALDPLLHALHAPLHGRPLRLPPTLPYGPYTHPRSIDHRLSASLCAALCAARGSRRRFFFRTP